MRRYFVRLPEGGSKEVENKNDAIERVERGLATRWWKTEDGSTEEPVSEED